MKTVNLFEKDDTVIITKGVYKGKIGIVTEDHEDLQDDVFVALCEDIYVDEDGEENCDDTTEFNHDELKLITQKEYKVALNKSKGIQLKVPSMRYPLLVKNQELKVGCQKISFKDAKLIANFINKNCTTKKKK